MLNERIFFCWINHIKHKFKHFPVACWTCLLDSTVKLQFNLQNTKENNSNLADTADISVIVL